MSENKQSIPDLDKLNDTTQPQQNQVDKQVPKEAPNQNVERQNHLPNEHLNINSHSNNDEGLYDDYPDERPKEEEPDPNNSEIPKNQQATFYDEPLQFKTQPAEDQVHQDQAVIDQLDLDNVGPIVQGNEKTENQDPFLEINQLLLTNPNQLIKVKVSSLKNFILFEINQPSYLGKSLIFAYLISLEELKKLYLEICFAQKNQNVCFYFDIFSFQSISVHLPINFINKLFQNLPNNIIIIQKEIHPCFLNELLNEQCFDLYNQAQMVEQDSQIMYDDEVKFSEQCVIQQELMLDNSENEQYNEAYLNFEIVVQAQSEF